MLSHPHSVDSLDEGKTSNIVGGSDMAQIKDILENKISLEPPTPAPTGEARYLTRLWVGGNRELPEEISGFESSQSTSFEIKNDKMNNIENVQDKIKSVLKLLACRGQYVLVQFWSPHVVGNHQVLTTIDQPFGLGVIDKGLFLYRKDSERKLYVVDNNHKEEDLSPPTRVFYRGLPEWTSDISNYLPKHFPQQECAIQCNLHGYLALPVFDSTIGLCVGVLELLTSSKNMSHAYEVQQVYTLLKTKNLTTTQTYDHPTSIIRNEHRSNELEKIFNVMKVVCDNHRLPLAQTWAVPPLGTVASHEQILKMSCNSFNVGCLGKVCMSTASLPFYVQDLSLWLFRKACRERHLDNSRGFVGRALLSHGSCFCEDITKLDEEYYPLVHYAHMSGLKGCFAIFLHSVESNDDYVLEFFLPLNIDDGRYVQNLVHTLKHNLEMASGFELGDKSPIQVVGPCTEAGQYLDIDPHNSTMISSITTAKTKISETVSSDSESFVDVANTDSTRVFNQLSSQQDFFNNNEGMINSTENLVREVIVRDSINVAGARDNENATSDHDMSMQITNDIITDVRENNRLKRGRKRKLDSLTMEAVTKHVGKPIDEAAKSLGVSRSTLKRFCRDHNMSSWPLPKHNKKTVARATESKPSKKSPSKQNLQRSSNKHFGFFTVVILLVRVKRWSCSSKNHGFSGKWWTCGKHSNLPFKLDSMYQVARLMLYLKRWRNRKSTTHTIQNRDHPKNKINIINPVGSLVFASPKQIDASILSGIRKVTVKATFKDDMIKFQFPTSSGLFELEKEVAHRIKLQSKRFRLKYMDEDDDLILLACDADLHNLLGLSASNNSIIKLIIKVDE